MPEQQAGWGQVFMTIGQQVAELQRALTTTTGVQREYLLPEAQLVTPVETPVLNMLRRKPGNGKAVSWKEITGLATVGSVFYAEGGTPGATTTTYAARSAAYKNLGRLFGVTGLQIAAGANFQDQLVAERENALISLKEDEEDALINADGTGDTYEGLVTQTAAANGSYVAPIGGALALEDIDDALKECHDRGYQITHMLAAFSEAQAINDLLIAAGVHNVSLLNVTDQGAAAGQIRFKYYVDPITGYPVEIVPSIRLAAGTLLGIPNRLPAPVPGQGQDGVWLDVLLEYTEVELGKTGDTYNYFVKVYETLVYPGRHGAFKLTGITSP